MQAPSWASTWSAIRVGSRVKDLTGARLLNGRTGSEIISPSPQNLTIDLWPDTREIDSSELCNSGLTRPDGTPAYLFSALNSKTVDRHFAWMQEYGIDGAAVQRFAVHLGNSDSHRRLDVVLQNERAAAEGHGRIFFVMYDISGADQKSVVSDILADWHRLTNVEHITDSPSYLRHRAKPLLGIWGLGFKDRPLGPDQASQLIKALQSGDGSPAVTVLGGVPAGWRTLTAELKIGNAMVGSLSVAGCDQPVVGGTLRRRSRCRSIYA